MPYTLQKYLAIKGKEKLVKELKEKVANKIQ